MSLAIIGFGGAELLILLVLLTLSAALFGFWIWMLVDCATKEKDQNQQIIWLILIALVGIIGAPLYFFIRKLPRKTKIKHEARIGTTNTALHDQRTPDSLLNSGQNCDSENKNMTLGTKRNIALYAFLISSVIFGVVDLLLYTNADWDSISLVLNTIIGTILILVGCRYDARLQNYPLSGGNSVLVWGFPIIGVPVYLVRSRGWTPAAKIGFGLPIFALSIGLYYGSWYGTRLIAEHAGYFE